MACSRESFTFYVKYSLVYIYIYTWNVGTVEIGDYYYFFNKEVETSQHKATTRLRTFFFFVTAT
jgi:hypothetical protein